MRLILSRKGFDTSSGGCPSPILPNERMVSLPIPDKQSTISYEEISYDGRNLGAIVNSLTNGRIPSHYGAHLDPDLVHESLPRHSEWRPIFGQTGAAQGHLRNNGIRPGDLFLFFGLFRPVVKTPSGYAWAKKSPPYHAIWGWLQIGEILPLCDPRSSGYKWASYHPHFNRNPDPNNVVYLASDNLCLGDRESQTGAGVFPRCTKDLILTSKNAQTPSEWELPDWFFPSDSRKPLTYHSDPTRWKKLGTQTILQSVARGQEFILDCDDYPSAIPWLEHMLQGKR